MVASPSGVDASGLPPVALFEPPQAGAKSAKATATTKTLVPNDVISPPRLPRARCNTVVHDRVPPAGAGGRPPPSEIMN
jgi:hypothetical protein